MEEQCVNMAIRIKPGKDDAQNCLEIIAEEPPVIYVNNRKNTFYPCDHVFGKESKQSDLFKVLIEPLIVKVLKGITCTVFAYGQTGSGKSYTMGTDLNQNEENEEAGIIQRTIYELLKKKEELHEDIKLEISSYEVYNSKVYDFLSEKNEALILTGSNRQNMCVKEICNKEDVQKILGTLLQQRRIAETKQNKFSSRSHCFLTINCTIKSKSKPVLQSKFNLVDLAGSESVGKNMLPKGCPSLKEGVSINQSLLHLGNVIKALQTQQRYVPYRGSVVTMLLKDSLSLQNSITLIACVNPELDNLTETLQTLQFASNVKSIRIKPEVMQIVEAKNKKQMSEIYSKDSSFLDMKSPEPSSSALLSKLKNKSTLKRYHSNNSLTETNKELFKTPNGKSLSLTRAAAFKQATMPSTIKKPKLENMTNLNLKMKIPAIPISTPKKQIASVTKLDDEGVFKMPSLPVTSTPFVVVSKTSEENNDKKQINNDKENFNFTLNKDKEKEQLINWDTLNLSNVTKRNTTKSTLQSFLSKTPEAVNFSRRINKEDSFLGFTKFTEPKFKVPMTRRRTVLTLKLDMDEETTQEENLKKEERRTSKRKLKIDSEFVNQTCVENEKNESTLGLIETTIFNSTKNTTFCVRRSQRIAKLEETLKNQTMMEEEEKNKAQNTTKRRINQQKNNKGKAKKKQENVNEDKNKENIAPFNKEEHEKYILSILNSADEKQLIKLSTVGKQRASDLILFRRKFGLIKSLKDLKEHFRWEGESYQRFLTKNGLEDT